MARNHRDELIVGNYYHIYNKVVSDVKLFREQNDYSDFINRYNRYFSRYSILHAYCLMQNHFHLLIHVKAPLTSHVIKEKTNAATKYLVNEYTLNEFLENQFSRMFSGIALRYNKKYRRMGPLFKSGLKRVHIRTDHRIIYLICYIHHNPIHHGYTKSYDNWRYSSYKNYCSLDSIKYNLNIKIELYDVREDAHVLHEKFRLLSQRATKDR